jgi:hypothetical protein
MSELQHKGVGAQHPPTGMSASLVMVSTERAVVAMDGPKKRQDKLPLSEELGCATGDTVKN